MIFRASNLLRGVIQFSSRGSEHAAHSFRSERESRILHGLRSMSIAKASKPGAGNIGLSEAVCKNIRMYIALMAHYPCM